MITPQVPTGGLIGQAVLHDESHGQGNDTMRVVGLGQSVLGGVRIEVLGALGAKVLRISQFDIAGSALNQIAHVMQQSLAGPVSKARLAALWTRQVWVVATA